MHYATAPKQHSITNSSAAAQKTALACPMLQHAMQCCSTSCHASAYCTTMLWHKKGPQHKVQCCGTKNIACVTSPMPWHKKELHGNGTMPQHIMEGRGTKYNAVALITLLQNKAQCCGTKAPPRHKNSAAAQKTAQWHKVQCHGTQNSAATQK